MPDRALGAVLGEALAQRRARRARRVCSVRKVARSASVPRWRQAARARADGARSRTHTEVRSGRANAPASSPRPRRHRKSISSVPSSSSRGRLGSAASVAAAPVAGAVGDDRALDHPRAEAAGLVVAAACRPCRGRSCRRSASSSSIFAARASSSRVAMLEREATRSWIERRSTVCQCLKIFSSTTMNRSDDRSISVGSSSCSWVPMIRPELLDPGDALVAHVPDQRQPAPRLQHPPDLRQRARRGRTSGSTARRPRRRTRCRGRGSPPRHLRRCAPGQVGAQDLEHRLVGVGGVYVVAERDQLLGELAGAGAELEDGQRLVGPVSQAAASRRVAGSAAVVGLGDPTEGPGLALLRHRSSSRGYPLRPSLRFRQWLRIPLRGWCLSRACRRRTPRCATASTSCSATGDCGGPRPSTPRESLLRGAHASAVLEGSSSSLAEVREGTGDQIANDAIRVSTELLSLVTRARPHAAPGPGPAALAGGDRLGRRRPARPAARRRVGGTRSSATWPRC